MSNEIRGYGDEGFWSETLPEETDLDNFPEEESVEDVLTHHGIKDDVYEVANPYRNPILLDKIIEEVATNLKRLQVRDVENLNPDRFLEICKMAGVAPEVRRAYIAVEDILFNIEAKNLEERTLSEDPSTEDLYEEAEQIEDFVELQNKTTEDAYLFISRHIKDPILTLPQLIARKALLLKDLQNLKREKVESAGEFRVAQIRIEELNNEIEEVETRIHSLVEIEEVRERRERAFRRMHWLLRQDYLRPGIEAFLTTMKKEGEQVDFATLATFVSGTYQDRVVIKNKQNTEETVPGPSQSDEPAISDDETTTRREREYIPGLVDVLLNDHIRSTLENTNRTEMQKHRDKVKLRRLEQAKALTVAVFQEDLVDRIYYDSPVTKSEHKMLEFVRNRLYIYGDTSILSSFIDLLPGSPFMRIGNKDLDTVPLSRKFSGRSKSDLEEEIGQVIAEHPYIERDRIAELVEARHSQVGFTQGHAIELNVDALTILEKLVYKENHTVSGLIDAN